MRVAGRVLLWFLSIGVAAYAVFAYAFLPLGTTVEPGMRAGFRKDHARIHRWLGRAYLGFGVLVGGLSALYLAQFAYGGPAARIGFGALGLAWLYTGLRAFLAIRSGAVADHRRWMIRNFALTFAAVMLRLYLPVSLAAGADFERAYAVIAWLCWVPNLLLVEWLFNRSRPPRPAI